MEITFTENNGFALSGELDLGNLNDVINALTQHPLPVSTELSFNLTHMEMSSTLALIAFANLMTALSKRVRHIQLDGAPVALVDHLKEAQARKKLYGVSFINTRELVAAD